MSARCVIDASVAVKLFIAESLSDKADELFDLLASGESATFYVPDAFYYEVAATLRKYALTAGYPNIKGDTARLCALHLHMTPTVELLLDAVEISLTHTLSTYDALYLALSAREKAPLITADERLVRLMQDKPFDVRALASLDFSVL